MSYEINVDISKTHAVTELINAFVDKSKVFENHPTLIAEASNVLQVQEVKGFVGDDLDSVRKAQAVLVPSTYGADKVKGQALVNYTRLVIDEKLNAALHQLLTDANYEFMLDQTFVKEGQYEVMFTRDPIYTAEGTKTDADFAATLSSAAEQVKAHLVSVFTDMNSSEGNALTVVATGSFEHPENGEQGSFAAFNVTVEDGVGLVGRQLTFTFKVNNSNKPKVDERVDISTEDPVELDVFR